MFDKLKQEIIEILQENQLGHIALSSPAGPWASTVRFISVDLNLYLIEPSASDLVFYVEGNSLAAFTISVRNSQSSPIEYLRQSIEIFGTAKVVDRQELTEEPSVIQTAFTLRNRQTPGIYVVVKIEPKRIYRVLDDSGVIRRDTLDIVQSERN